MQRIFRIDWEILVRPCIAAAVIGWVTFVQTVLGQDTQVALVRQKYGFLGRGQTIAIIDTGITFNHEAFGGGFGSGFRVVGGYDFTGSGDASPHDDPGPLGGHGTKVASIAAGGLNSDSPGVSPGADLAALRVFADSGTGYYSWVEQALRWVRDNRNAFASPITTVNLSLGSAWNSNTVPPGSPIEDELAQLRSLGIFISASAGNDFVTYEAPGLAYPAASPFVVPAMSTDADGQLSYFSQRHSRAIAAPGRSLAVALPDYLGNHDGIHNDYSLASGSDLSASYLAGASVLVREAMLFNGTNGITQSLIYDHLVATSDQIYDSATGAYYQRLNLLRAIDALMPADDIGSTIATATDLGSLQVGLQQTGIANTSNDRDFFVFTASRSGTVLFNSTVTDYLEPLWTIQDARGRAVASQAGLEFSFPVDAGKRYFISLRTRSGIGRYTANLLLEQPMAGDYNADGIVDAADYTVWRNTLGSNNDLRADGNHSQVIDDADYSTWKSNFAQESLPPLAGDFNADRRVDAADFTIWRDTLGSLTDRRADADNNGIVDSSDYQVWKMNLGLSTHLPLPGDYNSDGYIDAADYTVWRDTRDSIHDLRADGNEDGVVDALDYDLWKSQFTAGIVAAIQPVSIAVPEPGVSAIIVAMLLGIQLTPIGRREGSR